MLTIQYAGNSGNYRKLVNRKVLVRIGLILPSLCLPAHFLNRNLLQRKPETFLSLKDPLSPISLPVRPAIHNKILQDMKNRQNLRHDYRNHSRPVSLVSKLQAAVDLENLRVLREVVLAEDICRRNATTRSTPNQQRTRHTPLHLPDNIVVHIAQQAGHIAVRARDPQKHARIPRIRVAQPPHHHDPHNCNTAIQYNNRAPHPEPIRHPRSPKHPHRRHHIRRETQDLRHRH